MRQNQVVTLLIYGGLPLGLIVSFLGYYFNLYPYGAIPFVFILIFFILIGTILFWFGN